MANKCNTRRIINVFITISACKKIQLRHLRPDVQLLIEGVTSERGWFPFQAVQEQGAEPLRSPSETHQKSRSFVAFEQKIKK